MKLGQRFQRITPENDLWDTVEVVGFHTGGVGGEVTEPVVRTLEFGAAPESVDPAAFLTQYAPANPADAAQARLAAIAEAAP